MEKPQLIIDGKRLDGREMEDLRPVKITAHVLNDANGSAYVEWGKNKILAGVYGPRECIPRHDQSLIRAVVRARYNMAPFCSLEEHGRSGPSRRSVELSKVISEVFENVIISEAYPKTQIQIFIEVLQSDGGTRCAAVTAAAVALADAGIPMRDLVCAVAVGKADGQLVLDCSKEEDNYGESDMPVAIAPRNGEILLFQMDGLLTRDEIDTGLTMVQRAAEKISAMQAAALQQVYERKTAPKLEM
jgi:exosome complex component RRP41